MDERFRQFLNGKLRGAHVEITYVDTQSAGGKMRTLQGTLERITMGPTGPLVVVDRTKTPFLGITQGITTISTYPLESPLFTNTKVADAYSESNFPQNDRDREVLSRNGYWHGSTFTEL